MMLNICSGSTDLAPINLTLIIQLITIAKYMKLNAENIFPINSLKRRDKCMHHLI